MAKIDHSLFDADSHALENAYGSCPKCASPLALKYGKSGAFIGCSNYPTCDYSKPLKEHADSLVKLIEGSQCPQCGSALAVKKGKYGLFIGCSDFPICNYIASQTDKPPTRVTCPSCQQGQLVEKTNRHGKTFFACDQYPKCKYLINLPPVAKPCPACGWSILVKRQKGDDALLQCPQRDCNYSEKI